MKALAYHMGKQFRTNRLLEALDIGISPHMVISLVGAGGKTTTMYQLAEELAAMGKRVIVTTSTHIGYPGNYPVCPAKLAEQVKGYAGAVPILVTGNLTKDGKLEGLLQEEIPLLAEMADVLLIEADGAKGLPLKAPREHEPVIIPGTHLVLGICGLSCLSRTWMESCFCWELAEKQFGIRGNEKILPRDVARILTDERGAKKGVNGMEYRIILNQADDQRQEKKGMEIFQRIPRERGAITSYY